MPMSLDFRATCRCTAHSKVGRRRCKFAGIKAAVNSAARADLQSTVVRAISRLVRGSRHPANNLSQCILASDEGRWLRVHSRPFVSRIARQLSPASTSRNVDADGTGQEPSSGVPSEKVLVFVCKPQSKVQRHFGHNGPCNFLRAHQ